jgi:hypothetical protein
MTNGNTIINLETEERYAEAGYGRLFAYNSSRFNAMIDARSKAKFIKKMNPETYDQTQNGITYSGPTVFFRQDIDIKNHKIDKMDIKSAYLAYLVNEQIKKPGIFRVKHHGSIPLTDNVALYVIKFQCAADSLFVKWFLNSSAIHKKKFQTNGTIIWGEIGIFASNWMNNLKYVNKFLSPEQTEVVKVYTFHGKDTVECKKEQIHKLYEMKESGVKKAKLMLVQSTGWLSIIDKPTYYHMVQYIKWYLLKSIYDYGLEDDYFGVQTDCMFVRVTEENDPILQWMFENNTLANKISTIGNWTSQRVNYDEIITNQARVVLK